MKTILFLSKSEHSSSTRYRALQFAQSLADAGYQIEHASISGGRWVAALAQAGRADIVVVLRKTLPKPVLWLFRKVSRRLVFDFDDAIFCNTDGSASPTRMQRFAAMASVCDYIFAGNGFLAHKAKCFNPNVCILPTCIDVARYAVDVDKPSESFDLVWIGSRATRKYLIDALPALRLAAARVPTLRLKVIADFDLPEAGFPVQVVPWSSASEVDDLASAHVGLAPMRDDDWSRGKCALKVLQYMAAGLPVVSSAVGVNADVVENGVNGYLATNEREWCERIVELACSEDERCRMGLAGREKVRAGYDLPVVVARMLNVFNQLSRE